MTFKIKLVKELEQNKSASNVDMDCFIHPYREYIVEYLTGENYKIKLLKKDEDIVYSYIYNAKRRIPEVFEYKNPKYHAIIVALEEAGYIKKILLKV